MTGRGVDEITYGQGGWVRYQAQNLSVPVFLRFEERHGRLVPVDLFVPALDDVGLSAALLRKVPLGHIEAWVNEAQAGRRVATGFRNPGPDLRRAVATFTKIKPTKGSSWTADMYWAQVPAAKVFQPGIGRLAEPLDATEETPPDATLEVPAGRPYGDDFYRRVAAVYQAVLRHHRSPAGAIADANHVPPSTVHRWVKEARRRGYLPPGQQGKAG